MVPGPMSGSVYTHAAMADKSLAEELAMLSKSSYYGYDTHREELPLLNVVHFDLGICTSNTEQCPIGARLF